MNLGYSTNAFVKHSLAHAVEKISRLGFSGIEIMADRPHLYPPDWDETGLLDLRAHLETMNLKVTNLNSFTLFAVGDTYLPSWIESSEDRRRIRIQHTLDCLRLASFLGCGNISVPPGGPLKGMGRKEATRLFHEGIDRVVPLAEELGVKLLVEPEPDLLLENTAEFIGFIREVRSRAVGINFDIGHFFCAGEDPAEAFEKLFEHVGHCHLEDIGTDRRHHHLIPGKGSIDFLNVLRTIRRSGYAGDISLELYTYPDEPEEAGAESIRFLMPLFEEAGFDFTRMNGQPGVQR